MSEQTSKLKSLLLSFPPLHPYRQTFHRQQPKHENFPGLGRTATGGRNVGKFELLPLFFVRARLEFFAIFESLLLAPKTVAQLRAPHFLPGVQRAEDRQKCNRCSTARLERSF